MNLQDCLHTLEKSGRIAHIRSEVDAVHELSGIAAKREGGKVAFFRKTLPKSSTPRKTTSPSSLPVPYPKCRAHPWLRCWSRTRPHRKW